jgi:hypothetical protein
VTAWQIIIDKIILFKERNDISTTEFFKLWGFLENKNLTFTSTECIKRRMKKLDSVFNYRTIVYGVYVSYEEKLNYFLSEYKGKKITIDINFFCFNTKKKKIVCVFFNFMKKNYILGIFEDIYHKIECLKNFKIFSHSLDFEIHSKFAGFEIGNIDELDNLNLLKIFKYIKFSYSNDCAFNFSMFEELIKKITRVEILNHLYK